MRRILHYLRLFRRWGLSALSSVTSTLSHLKFGATRLFQSIRNTVVGPPEHEFLYIDVVYEGAEPKGGWQRIIGRRQIGREYLQLEVIDVWCPRCGENHVLTTDRFDEDGRSDYPLRCDCGWVGIPKLDGWPGERGLRVTKGNQSKVSEG